MAGGLSGTGDVMEKGVIAGGNAEGKEHCDVHLAVVAVEINVPGGTRPGDGGRGRLRKDACRPTRVR